MSISTLPTNTNLAQASKFLLSFARLPNLTYFCTKVDVPGISVDSASQPTPGVTAPVPGNKFVYDPLNIRFLLDENLYAWTSILDWMKGYGFPENSDQYKNLNLQQRLQLADKDKMQYSDAILTYFTNKNNPVLQVKFYQIFPVSLTPINFDAAQSALEVLSATAMFKYTNYEIIRLK